jgi:hypothetical protein
MITVAVTVSRKMAAGMFLVVVLLLVGVVYGRQLWGHGEVEYVYRIFRMDQATEGCIFYHYHDQFVSIGSWKPGNIIWESNSGYVRTQFWSGAPEGRSIYRCPR